MSSIITCDLCGKRIQPVSASDSLMSNPPYGDRIEVSTLISRRSMWGYGPVHRRLENTQQIDAHPECVKRLFESEANNE